MFVRRFGTTASRGAVAVRKPTPVARAPYRAAVKPVAARAPLAAPSSTPAAGSSAPAAPAASFDDFADADFVMPDPEISDYAHLRRPAAPAAPAAAARRAPPAMTPTPSPPLSSLPDASYVPLPSASLGSSDMQEAYAFSGRLPGETPVSDWTTSFKGLSERPFDKEVADALLRPLDPEDVELKPDGLLYLPEIKYRRTLNAAFGPGGWGMAPRGETHVGPRIVSREWGLVCLGRLVAVARGEQEYFDPSGVPTATEACKSNALMRCCKDLGIASELWDPVFIRKFKAKHAVEMMVEHVVQKKKRKLWRKKEGKFDYPYKEIGPVPR